MSLHNTASNKPKAKVVLVGAASAGKTSLVTRLTTSAYSEDSVTIGASYFAYEVKVPPVSLTQSKFDHYLTRFFHNPDHRSPYPDSNNPTPSSKDQNTPAEVPINYPMAIWDTAGSENYAKLIRMYFRDADCALICYDITSLDSWNHVDKSIESVLDLSPDALIILVATKKDLVIGKPAQSSRCIPINEIREFALQRGVIVFETSAKLDTACFAVDWTEELFTFIANELVYRQHQNQREIDLQAQQRQQQQIDINTVPNQDKGGGCC